MDLKYSAFEFLADFSFVYRNGHSYQGVIAIELPTPVFDSEILEGDLPRRLRVHFNGVLGGALYSHSLLFYVG